MIKQFLRIGFLTILFVGLVIIVRAEDFEDDLLQSREYRQTSDKIHFTQVSHLLRDARKDGHKSFTRDVRKDAVSQALHESTKRENYEYAQVIKNVAGIVPGITTDKELTDWFGLADEVIAGDSIIPVEYEVSLSDSGYHITLNEYPRPKENQYIFARNFYFAEERAPFIGNRLHVLVTLDKNTGIVDHYACYNEDGVILSYWRYDLVS